MPRSKRNVIPDHPHHVVLRGNNRRRLFSFVPDYLRFLALMVLAIERTDCELHAVVLMTNHVHILLTPASREDLSECVKTFSQRYAQHRNRIRGGTGKLFEERYYSKPIVDDAHYAATHAYTDLNPYRAGIVGHPGDYRWSTYRMHAGTEDGRLGELLGPVWTPSGWYEALSSDPARRTRMYAEWVDDCREVGRRPAHADQIDRIERWPSRGTPRRPDGSRAA